MTARTRLLNCEGWQLHGSNQTILSCPHDNFCRRTLADSDVSIIYIETSLLADYEAGRCSSTTRTGHTDYSSICGLVHAAFWLLINRPWPITPASDPTVVALPTSKIFRRLPAVPARPNVRLLSLPHAFIIRRSMRAAAPEPDSRCQCLSRRHKRAPAPTGCGRLVS
jgi:hypothetical protein